jgi:hypothetical protein
VSDRAQAFLQGWHQIVAEKDVVGIGSVLAANVALGAPPYWDKIQGREVVQHLLGLIVNTIEDFTYHREWCEGDELALEFTGHVDGLDLQGIDLISLDSEAKIRNLDVLMRPVNAVIALRETIAPRMAAFLAERAASSG